MPTRPTSPPRSLRAVGAACVTLALASVTGAAHAQDAATARATVRVRVRVTVRADDAPVAGAVVRTLDAPPVGAQTDASGVAVLRLDAGPRALVVGRLGYRADTLRLTLRAGQDTAVAVALEEQEAEAIVVTATRGERRVEDTPLRVEVIDEEEIAEKVAMTPGDVAMMLNETSGLRVQTINPSLGGADVRVQGLRGRYTLILADGLPLYGQAGGLGLLQIPPVDLARVEIVKGTASALYGSAALGGVVNLVSRRPTEEAARTVLLNGTSRAGVDGVTFLAGPVAAHWGYTLLAGAHGQRRVDPDGDGWADLPAYERGVVRPRLHYDDGRGRTAFLTGGLTLESREGGTLPGRVLPTGGAYQEALRTGRGDVGGLARWVLPEDAALHGGILTVRGSAVEQRHRHAFGPTRERDRHRTAFGEAALALPRGRATYVGGVAVQRDAYRAEDVAGFDYAYTTPAAFAQLDLDPAPWLALSGSARVDAHSAYGTFVNPRLSALVRRVGEGALTGWTVRASGGTGAFAPTPFTEETEATGLAQVAPLRGLVAERARSASLDLGGPIATALGRLELNATLFGARVRRPLLVREVPGSADVDGRTPRLALANAARPTVTWGTDAFARLRVDGVLGGQLGVFGSYVFLRAREDDPEGGARREVPLTPRHAAGLDVIWEAEGRARAGLELYYTGRQSLADDPYRVASRPYLLVGLLGEWRVPVRGAGARLFVNAENLGDVRQTRWNPLLRPTRGAGGRWTTDVWTDLAGTTVNAGVRLEL